MSGFATLGVPETILEALQAKGYEEPTAVQREAIPVLLAGRDALVEAETGSGKTAAFGVPAVKAGGIGRGIRVLVLVPTRELARQVTDELRAIGTGSPFRAVALTGGLSEEQEERQLSGDVRCAVATPGRLLALMEARKITFRHLELLVLDEADRMLDMGFRADVEQILLAADRRKQTALFSATLPRGVRDLAAAHLNAPVEVRVGAAAMPKSLQHHRLNVMKGQKEPAIVALLKKEDPQRAMVFLRTRDRAAKYTKILKAAGFAADALQGNMTHEQRRHVFDLFSRGITHILVATDLASRGLDVPAMELVVNVDLPDEDETYMHRSGRAARMGRPGRVVTFVLPEEKDHRLRLERVGGVEFVPYRLEFTPEDLPASVREGAPRPPPKKKPGQKKPLDPDARPKSMPAKKANTFDLDEDEPAARPRGPARKPGGASGRPASGGRAPSRPAARSERPASGGRPSTRKSAGGSGRSKPSGRIPSRKAAEGGPGRPARKAPSKKSPERAGGRSRTPSKRGGPQTSRRPGATGGGRPPAKKGARKGGKGRGK